MSKPIFLLSIISVLFGGFNVSFVLAQGISSMVKLEKNTFLTVNDKKNKQEQGAPYPKKTKPRFGIVKVKKKRVDFDELQITYHPTMIDMPPNDLEAVCKLPGRKDEVFVAESGYFKGRFGRVFLLRLNEIEKKWHAKVLSVFEPFPESSDEFTTPDPQQIEGMSCIEDPEVKGWLIFARRGGKGKAAKLVWGPLNWVNKNYPVFSEQSQVTLEEGTQLLGDRGAADLYLKKIDDDQWKVWTIAVEDSGNDFGPFRSVIYSPGVFIWEKGEGLRFKKTKLVVGWRRGGLKVEAIAGPAKRVKGSVLSIGTEDEALGGIWQPLFSVEQSFTSHRNP